MLQEPVDNRPRGIRNDACSNCEYESFATVRRCGVGKHAVYLPVIEERERAECHLNRSHRSGCPATGSKGSEWRGAAPDRVTSAYIITGGCPYARPVGVRRLSPDSREIAVSVEPATVHTLHELAPRAFTSS